MDSILPLFKLVFDTKALLPGRGEYVSPLVTMEIAKPLALRLNFLIRAKRAISSIRNANWEKFNYYAQRVRSIDIDPDGLKLLHVSTSLRLVVESMDYPFGPSFLPHVWRVKWIACCPACQLSMLRFTSSSTVDLELDLKSVSLIGSLQKIAPDIRELALRMTEPKPVGSLEAPLSRWISSLRHLTALWLPPHYLSKTIVAAAGELRELKELKIMPEPSVIPDEEGKEMEFRPDTFPRLRTIECNLREISLILFLDKPTSAESFGRPLDMDFLYGLAPCHNLVSLCVAHSFPMTLTDDDVRWIGTAWKDPKTLVLCIDPESNRLITPEMGTSIFTLALFAELLPNLSHLGLYFRNRDAVRFSGNLHPQHQLARIMFAIRSQHCISSLS
ncbi:hypothetical protein FRC00_008222 [Tulasnella sp. 408]|nr:hypothetical protein FRC00_008222 [Tulasnella sp. 408]